MSSETNQKRTSDSNSTPNSLPTAPEFRSRWGYHPCNYEFYLKLKFLRKHYWIALRQFHQWHRWFRKEPQNQFGVEPQYCPAFVENRLWAKKFIHKGEHRFKLYPRTVVDHGLLETFNAARMPNAQPVPTFDPAEIARLEKLYHSVKQYCREQYCENKSTFN